MKRNFSFFDAAFFLFLFFRLKEWPVFGHRVTFFLIALPYIMQSVEVIVSAVFKHYNVKKKIELFFWQKALTIRLNKVKKQAAENVKAAHNKASANPGQFVDPKNYGK